MSERLPTSVFCEACRHVVPASRARRYIDLWARIGKGGSLSGIKDQEAHARYRCDDCVRDGKFTDDQEQQGVLL